MMMTEMEEKEEEEESKCEMKIDFTTVKSKKARCIEVSVGAEEKGIKFFSFSLRRWKTIYYLPNVC